jgi:hypothetical protein
VFPQELGYDAATEASLTSRVGSSNAALVAAGVDVVFVIITTVPSDAERIIRETMAKAEFGVAMIGAGLRLLPENSVLFERVINAVIDVSPRIRLCFNTKPEDTIEAVARWI